MIGVQAEVKIKRKVGGRERKVGRGEDPRLAIGMDLLKTKEI